jgi:hypothetical protein
MLGFGPMSKFYGSFSRTLHKNFESEAKPLEESSRFVEVFIKGNT